MIHPSALKKALKERKKRILFLFPFPLLIGVLIFRPKDSLPNEPLSPPPAIIPVLPQKKEKAGLVPPVGILLKGCFIPIPLCRIPFLRLKMIPLSLLGKGKRLKAQCCALAESSRSTDAAKHSS